MAGRTRILDGKLSSSVFDHSHPPFVAMGTTLDEVTALLEQIHYRHVFVTDSDGSVLGVVSKADVFKAVEASEMDGKSTWRRKAIESLMVGRFRDRVTTLRRDQSHPLISGSSFRCSPVMDDDGLVGVMTEDDFLVSWQRIEPLIVATAQDHLTELSSRANFFRRLHEEWDRSTRNKSPIALLFFDLDGFKQVNDLCGHPTGDAVLAMVGTCLRQQLRSYDVVGRLGGDEFAVLCCDCQPDEVVAPILRVRESVRSLPMLPQLGGRRLTVSIGAAVVTAGFDRLNVTSWISAADECLYAAKRAGRDCAYQVVLDREHNQSPRPVANAESLVASGT